MDDVLGGITGPRDVFLAFFQWCTNSMYTGHKFAIFTQCLKYLGTDTGHNVHIGHNIRGVRKLHTDMGNR